MVQGQRAFYLYFFLKLNNPPMSSNTTKQTLCIIRDWCLHWSFLDRVGRANKSRDPKSIVWFWQLLDRYVYVDNYCDPPPACEHAPMCIWEPHTRHPLHIHRAMTSFNPPLTGFYCTFKFNFLKIHRTHIKIISFWPWVPLPLCTWIIHACILYPAILYLL